LRAAALGYITQERGTNLLDELRQLSRMLHGLIQSLDR